MQILQSPLLVLVFTIENSKFGAPAVILTRQTDSLTYFQSLDDRCNPLCCLSSQLNRCVCISCHYLDQ